MKYKKVCYEENVLGFSFDTPTTIYWNLPKDERPEINQVGGLQLKK